MKKLFRIHFAAIVVSDLLLLVTFRPRYELSLERGLIFCFIFILAQGLLLFRLVNRLKKHFAWSQSSDEQKNSPLLYRDSLRRPTISCLFSHHWPSTFLLSYSSLYFLSFYFLLYDSWPPKRKLSRLLQQTYLFVGMSLRKRRFYHEKHHIHQNHSTPYYRWNHAGIFDI